MAAPLDGEVTLDGHAEQRQIAEQVEHLVAHELVRPAQPVAIQDAVVVHHHGVVEVAAPGQAVAPEHLDLPQEAEGARAADLLLEDVPVDLQIPDLLPADRRMREVDRVAHAEPRARLDADGAVAVANLESATDAQAPARGVLLEDASRADQEYERGG